jgi:hypothetical protein
MSMSKEERIARFDRRKGSKLRDHQRAGKRGMVDGNPRYHETRRVGNAELAKALALFTVIMSRQQAEADIYGV